MRKLLWTLLTTAVSTACAAAAVRALEWAWRRIEKQDPPARGRWAFLIRKPLRSLLEGGR
jgi:hypothetical protein